LLSFSVTVIRVNIFVTIFFAFHFLLLILLLFFKLIFCYHTGWGCQSWTTTGFFLCIGLHALLKLMLGLKSTGWCGLDPWLIIYSIFTSYFLAAAGLQKAVYDSSPHPVSFATSVCFPLNITHSAKCHFHRHPSKEYHENLLWKGSVPVKRNRPSRSVQLASVKCRKEQE
jgi:hypothetical protein